MASKYKVNRGCTVLYKGTILHAGAPIPEDFPARGLKSNLDTGHIILSTDPFSQPNHRKGTLVVRSEVDLTPTGTREQRNMLRSKPLSEPVKQQNSKWDLDPKTLEGKGLDDLNVMILERDDKQEPFETPEEARAFLSADFKG